jgi:hypothetical protein
MNKIMGTQQTIENYFVGKLNREQEAAMPFVIALKCHIYAYMALALLLSYFSKVLMRISS